MIKWISTSETITDKVTVVKFLFVKNMHISYKIENSPVIVSGLGTSPGRHLQIGLPSMLAVQVVPGPHGLGLHGSGFSIHL